MFKFVKVIFKFCDEHKVIAISPAKIPAGIGLQNSFTRIPLLLGKLPQKTETMLNVRNN